MLVGLSALWHNPQSSMASNLNPPSTAPSGRCHETKPRSAWLGALLAGIGLLGLGCRAGDGRAKPAVVSPVSATRLWTYRVKAGPASRQLSVDAELPAGVPAELGVDRFAHPYVTAVELKTEAGFRPIRRVGRRWTVPRCHSHGCRLRYRYQLHDAAEDIDRFGFAGYRAGVLLAPPSTWLLHPQGYTGADEYRFVVETSGRQRFVTGVWPSPSRGAGYQARADLLFEAPYSGFGQFKRRSLSVPGGVVHVVVAEPTEQLTLSEDELALSLARSARVVAQYFGGLPVRAVSVLVLPVDGDDVVGMQLGNGGASILLFLGRRATAADLQTDWVVVHEMLHLGVPSMPRPHRWLAEGLATYQEPIVRARAGLIAERRVWEDFIRSMPLGLPDAADRGLDGTTSWGRLYWGGAIFCLLADIALRSRAQSPASLDLALRGVVEQGGNTAARWSLRRVLQVADDAVGGRVLQDLYREHATAGVNVDLEALFARLGVRRVGSSVELNEGAELAHVRRAITAPRR